MSVFLKSSIGKKLLMSLSGLFLIAFLCVHLGINLLLLFGDGTSFNLAANFMGSSPIMKVMEPILVIGFLLHLIYASILTFQNQQARPQNYSKINSGGSSKWASRNMFVLGGLVFIFLVVHIINFFWKIKFGSVPSISINGEEMHNTYALVSGLFISYWWYDVIYVIGAILLGLHLHHAFWAAFQTIGLSNTIWRKRLEVVGDIFAILIAVGFSVIPLYFLILK